MTRHARPDELLVVGFMSEASGYPEFHRAQVVPVMNLKFGALRGRENLTVYLTDLAWRQLEIVGTDELRESVIAGGFEIKGVRDFLHGERPKRPFLERLGGAIFEPILKLIDRAIL